MSVRQAEALPLGEHFRPTDAYWELGPPIGYVPHGPAPAPFENRDRLDRAARLSGVTLAALARVPAEERQAHYAEAERIAAEVRAESEAILAKRIAQQGDAAVDTDRQAAPLITKSLARKLGRMLGLRK